VTAEKVIENRRIKHEKELYSLCKFNFDEYNALGKEVKDLEN
jgi:hypothetical protein